MRQAGRGRRGPVAGLGVLVAAAVLCTSPAGAQRGPVRATVVRAIDGDTIQVRIGETLTETVRYIGVNAPELDHPIRGSEPGGKNALEANRRLVEGQSVVLEFDAQERDAGLRLLAYVWANGVLVNAALVQQGFAAAATYPPNVRHAEYFRELQQRARDTEQGLWRDPVARSGATLTRPDTPARDPVALPLSPAGGPQGPRTYIPASGPGRPAMGGPSPAPAGMARPGPGPAAPGPGPGASAPGPSRPGGSPGGGYVMPYTRGAPRR
jgi:micrococcal nuclease